jgi:hypothetical protein
VTDAIDADQRLSSSQKKVLLDMYKALLATEVGQATTTKQEI